MLKKISYLSLSLILSGIYSVNSAEVKQGVVSRGMKVKEATENTIVSSVCKQKFYGCMDSFCMLDNTNGGRCMCSDRKSELDNILAEIDKIDAKSKQMATEGVENVKMGENAEEIRSRADTAVANVSKRADLKIAKEEAKEKKSGLDLSIFDSDVDFDNEVDNIFDKKEKQDAEVSLANKTGKALYDAVSTMCKSKMQECDKDAGMLAMMYSQQIKSDCGAYENYLQQRKKKSSELLAVAEREVRTAALDKFQEENKYDLGECVTEYSKCMVGYCGEDYSNCVGMANLEKESKGNQEMTSIRGFSSFQITQDTYDIIMSKKTQCDSVKKYCVKYKDSVWMKYLESAMPILKTAELNIQSNRRQNCLSEVSNCFLKACKDRIDPNNKEGSYDLCLAEPDAVKHLCQKQLNECGKIKEDNDIFKIVKLRLTAMRVDACTKQVKECLTSEDRCGKDYINCIGMDLESFKSICPAEKLVACSKEGKNVKMDDLDYMLQGIYASIDNKLANACQARVEEIFNKECPEGNCEKLFASAKIDLEKNSPIQLDKQSNGDWVMSGLIHYGALKIEKIDKNKLKIGLKGDETEEEKKEIAERNKKVDSIEQRDQPYHINIDGYLENIKNDPYKNRVGTYLKKLDASVSNVMNKFYTDPVISKCIHGRDMRQITGKTQGVKQRNFTTARFPSLLDGVSSAVMKTAIDIAQIAYSKTYEKELKKMTDVQSDEIKKGMCYGSVAGMKKCMQWSGIECKLWNTEQSLTNLFSNVSNSKDELYTYYKVSGAKLNDLTKLVSSAKKETNTVDPGTGSLLAKVEISASYHGDGRCEIETITTECKKKSSKYKKENVKNTKVKAFWGLISYESPNIEDVYQGESCDEFDDPRTGYQSFQI